MLKAIADRRVREKIMQRIDGLAEEPLQQGKPLLGPLIADFHEAKRCNIVG